MLELLRIVQNEWIKLLRRKRFAVVLMMSIAIVAVYAFGVSNSLKSENQFADIAWQKKLLQQSIDDLQKQAASTSLAPQQKTVLQDEIQDLTQQMVNLEGWQPGSGGPAFDQEQAQAKVALLKRKIAAVPIASQWQRGELELQLQIAEYRLENHLSAPVNAFMHEKTAWSVLKDFDRIGLALSLPLMIVLLVTDMVSGEMSEGTIKMLLTREPSRGKVLFGKYLTSLLASLLITGVMLATLTGSMVALLGTNGGEQPQAVNVKYERLKVTQDGDSSFVTVVDASQASVIPSKTFASTSMSLILISSIGMCTLGFLCSVVVRSPAVSTALSMGLVIVSQVMSAVAHGGGWLKGLLTTYFNLPYVWSGDMFDVHGVWVPFSTSLLVFAVWTVVLYGVCHLIFTRRDITE